MRVHPREGWIVTAVSSNPRFPSCLHHDDDHRHHLPPFCWERTGLAIFFVDQCSVEMMLASLRFRRCVRTGNRPRIDMILRV